METVLLKQHAIIIMDRHETMFCVIVTWLHRELLSGQESSLTNCTDWLQEIIWKVSNFDRYEIVPAFEWKNWWKTHPNDL